MLLVPWSSSSSAKEISRVVVRLTRHCCHVRVSFFPPLKGNFSPSGGEPPSWREVLSRRCEDTPAAVFTADSAVMEELFQRKKKSIGLTIHHVISAFDWTTAVVRSCWDSYFSLFVSLHLGLTPLFAAHCWNGCFHLFGVGQIMNKSKGVNAWLGRVVTKPSVMPLCDITVGWDWGPIIDYRSINYFFTGWVSFGNSAEVDFSSQWRCWSFCVRFRADSEPLTGRWVTRFLTVCLSKVAQTWFSHIPLRRRHASK